LKPTTSARSDPPPQRLDRECVRVTDVDIDRPRDAWRQFQSMLADRHAAPVEDPHHERPGSLVGIADGADVHADSLAAPDAERTEQHLLAILNRQGAIPQPERRQGDQHDQPDASNQA
jgi:hypothetical protein